MNTGELLDIYPQWAEIQSVAAPMKAGSCSFHNGLLAHGAGANMTPGLRRATTCGYMPDGCLYNGKPNILPQAYLDTLEVGDALDDNSVNPLIWHKTKPYVTARTKALRMRRCRLASSRVSLSKRSAGARFRRLATSPLVSDRLLQVRSGSCSWVRIHNPGFNVICSGFKNCRAFSTRSTISAGVSAIAPRTSTTPKPISLSVGN